MTHNELVGLSYQWVMKRCGVAFREFRSINEEIPDVIGFRCGESLIVECKASRSDFLSDKNKKHRTKGMGNFRFYCCPKRLIKREELPHKWGLLYVDENGKVRCVFNPYNEMGGNYWPKETGFTADIEAEHRLMYSALRRLQIRGHMEDVYTQPWSKEQDDAVCDATDAK